MADEFLADRKKSLEETFFAKQTEELKRKLREQELAQSKKSDLAAASGIQDEKVLDSLVARGIDAASLAALGLVPLVEVAWADGEIDSTERAAVLHAAEENGVEKGSSSHDMLEAWLSQRPHPDLLETWKAYVAALCQQLSAAEKQALRSDLLTRARTVAEATGGFLGLGRKVSAAEEALLGTLERAFG